MDDNHKLDSRQRKEENRKQLPTSARDWQKFHKNQTYSIIALAVFSLLVIALMAIQFHHNITSPFNYPTTSNSTVNASSSLVSDVEALKNKDTDGDGLSDYDEIYVYHTSPYLEDTDGDGFSDYEEVKNGTDPNCPSGQTCNNSTLNQTSTIVTPDMLPTISTSSSSGLSLNASTTNEALVQSVLAGQGDASALRQLLLDAGADKQLLDQLSDADLLQAYQDTLNQTSTSQINGQ